MNNQIAQKPTFSMVISGNTMQRLISNSIAEPSAQRRFTASLVSAVATNPALAECEPASIISAGLLGESLGLSPSASLGHFYMVPYNDRKAGTKKAQFQMGYKGMIQLAIRSGQYKKLNAIEVKKGELVGYNPFTDEVTLAPILDYQKREQLPTVGYYAMFETASGFRKEMYWSREKMEIHADKYSKAFSLAAYRKIQAGEIPENEMWKYSSYWYSSFDGMAIKTMLRQIISKWGIMSIDFQLAAALDENPIKVDNGIFAEDATALPEPPKVVEGGVSLNDL